jgi:hypothetical protein
VDGICHLLRLVKAEKVAGIETLLRMPLSARDVSGC